MQGGSIIMLIHKSKPFTKESSLNSAKVELLVDWRSGQGKTWFKTSFAIPGFM